MAPGQTFTDRDIRRFIESQPRRLTYSDLAAACLEHFGPKRAWSREQIRDYWLSVHPIRGGHTPAFEFDAEIREFVEDRLGRLTFGEIHGACRVEFGDRAPSRSAIARYSKMLARRRAAAPDSFAKPRARNAGTGKT